MQGSVLTDAMCVRHPGMQTDKASVHYPIAAAASLYTIFDMFSLRDIASSGLTVTLSPMQVVVGVGLLGIALVSNAKSVLFAWHGRLFLQLARHFFLRRPQLTIRSAQHGGEALFAPVVTASYTPLLDIDYNLHKSNSTFFSDLDDNRTELLIALFKDVVTPQPSGKATVPAKMFHLGGTSCIFKKSIAPFSQFEISSRILCWDQKWIYVVSHFTKPGSNNRAHLILGPWTKQQQGPVSDQSECIYATAMTKYVFKQGRKTCTPESVMQECGVLPRQDATKGSDGWKSGVDSHWSWEQVQEECNKHLEVAQNFGSLDQLHDTFLGRSGPAMYHY
ncbi:hypothetical protein ACEQ8H_002987 [Pleosporales sp. CAS-2024a]